MRLQLAEFRPVSLVLPAVQRCRLSSLRRSALIRVFENCPCGVRSPVQKADPSCDVLNRASLYSQRFKAMLVRHRTRYLERVRKDASTVSLFVRRRERRGNRERIVKSSPLEKGKRGVPAVNFCMLS